MVEQGQRASRSPSRSCWASPPSSGSSLPFKQNLERLGITGNVRTVDTAQYQNRIDDFDFDMVIERWGSRCRPATSSATSGARQAADTPGSRNSLGIKDPAVDELIDL